MSIKKRAMVVICTGILSSLVLMSGECFAFDFFTPEKVQTGGKEFLADNIIPIKMGDNHVKVIFSLKNVRSEKIEYDINSYDVNSTLVKSGFYEEKREYSSKIQRRNRVYFCELVVSPSFPGEYSVKIENQKTGGPPERWNEIRFFVKQ